MLSNSGTIYEILNWYFLSFVIFCHLLSSTKNIQKREIEKEKGYRKMCQKKGGEVPRKLSRSKRFWIRVFYSRFPKDDTTRH